MIRVMALCAVLLVPGVSSASTNMPWYDDFESYSDGEDIHGKHGWETNGGGAALIVSNLDLAHWGTNCCSMSDVTAAVTFTNSDTNVWTDFYLQPVFCPSASTNIPSDATTVFYVNTSSNIVAYDGTTAKTSSTPAVVKGEWTRFTVHTDYSASNWSLWMNGTNMADGFAFYSYSNANYTKFSIIEDTTFTNSYVDDINITNGIPAGLTTFILPFYETFETNPVYMAGTTGTVHNQHGWQVSGSGSALVQTNEAYNSSDQACSISNATLFHSFTDTAGYTNVWTDFYLQPGFCPSAPDIPSDATAVFYVNTSSNIVVFDGQTETTLTGTIVTNGAWTRFTVCSDYSATNWSLYYNGGLATSGLAFYTNTLTTYTKFGITENSISNWSYVDTISITLTNPGVGDADTDEDGMPDSWETSYGLDPSDATGTNGASGDWDGDGVKNIYEFLANTDPTKTNSYMRILSLDLVDENSDSIKIGMFIGTNRTFYMMAADNNATNAKTSVTNISMSVTGTNYWTNSSAVSACTQRFYSISVTYTHALSTVGGSYTNTENWAFYKQDRTTNERYLICVPIDYGSTNENNLAGKLGDQLMRGLYGNDTEADADKIRYINTNDSSWAQYYLTGSGSGVYKMQITFTNFAGKGTLTNFPALVKFTTNNTDNYTGFIDTTNGYDLRFWTNSTLTGSNLNYEIETWATNTNSYVWVQVTNFTHNCAIWASWGDESKTNQMPCTTNGDVWTEGYVGVWHLCNSKEDSSSYTNHGSGGDNTDAAGVIARGRFFDGADGDISVTDAPELRFDDQLTLSCWAKVNSWVGWSAIISKTADDDYELELNSTAGRYQFDCEELGDSDVYADGHDDGNWHYVVATYNDNSTISMIYSDGLFKDDDGANLSLDYNTDDVKIGARGTGNEFDGWIDEVRMSNVERSSNWVWACWMNQGTNHDSFVEYGGVEGGGGGEREWYDESTINMYVPPGMAFWLVRGSNAAPNRTNTVFTGKCFTESTVTNFTFKTNSYGWASNNWTMFGWPLPRAKTHSSTVATNATGTNQLGFCAAGATGGHTDDVDRPGEMGDQIWVWKNKTWKYYWLQGNWGDPDFDGRWMPAFPAGDFADFSLEPGMSYYYRHTTNYDGSNFTWKPED